MRGLKVFLIISLVFSVVFGLLNLIIPGTLVAAGMAPAEHWARYSGALFLGLALGNWYAFRNPAKNVAVIQAIIVIWGLTVLVELYNGATGALAWELTLPGAIFEAIVTAGLVYFYPRGESPT